MDIYSFFAGFGDLVPEHPIFMMATFIYLLFGLALTSMCINVVQEKLSAIFQKAKMQLGTTIGEEIFFVLLRFISMISPLTCITHAGGH